MMIRQIFKKKSLVLFTFCFAAITSQGQNVKISQYKMAPTFYNPATTGKFNGSLRVGTVYSRQETDSAAVNHAIAFGDYKYEQENGSIGVGVSYYQNSGADFKLTGKYFSASIAKHFFVDYDHYHMFSFGAQVTLANGRLVATKKLFSKEIADGGFTMPARNQSKTASYKDFNIGAMYTYNDETLKIEAGLAAYHALAPNDNMAGVQKRRIVLTTNTTLLIDDNNEVQLSTLLWKEGFRYVGKVPQVYENLINASYEKFVGETTAFYIGMGTRSFNTLIPLFGFSFNNNAIRVMGTYEQTIHRAVYDVNRGEVSVMVTL